MDYCVRYRRVTTPTKNESVTPVTPVTNKVLQPQPTNDEGVTPVTPVTPKNNNIQSERAEKIILSTFTKRNNHRPRFQFVQIISPILHHLMAFG